MNQKPAGKTPERYPTCGARTRKGTPCRLLAGYKTGATPGKGAASFTGAPLKAARSVTRTR
jgi:hypothetical protein